MMHLTTHLPGRRSLITLISGSLLALSAWSQPYYSFTQTSEPYQEITDGTPISFLSGWAQFVGLDGSTFWFCGQPYVFGSGGKELWLYDQGFINVDDNPENTLFLSVLFSPLVQIAPADATSNVTYKLTGTSGHRHLVIQWKNFRRSDGQDGHFLNFQVHLDQETSVIELRYGPLSDGGATYPSSSGPNVGYYYASYDASTIYDRIWLGGTPASPTTSTTHVAQFNGMTANPSEGTVYRFLPLFSTNTGINEEMAAAQPAFNYRLDGEGVQVHFNTAGEQGTIIVHDAAGRVVWMQARNGDDAIVPIALLRKGMYLLEYATVEGRRTTRRFVRP